MKTYLKQTTPEEREALADKVESSVGYFYLIAGGHRKPGTDLCKALVAAEPKLTLFELRPDIWEPPASADQLPGNLPDDAKVREAKGGARQPVETTKEMT